MFRRNTVFKKILNILKDPISPEKRRKYLFWWGVNGVIAVLIHQLIKLLLEKNTLNIFLFDAIFGSVCAILILISLYGKDEWVGVYFGDYKLFKKT